MKKLLQISLMCTAFFVGTCYAQADSAAAAPKASQTKKAQKKSSKKSTKSKEAKIYTDRGSEESPGERESRLRRECKGRPNAGACAGLTY